MAISRAKELVQEGLRRRLAGDLSGAAQAWRQALELDPSSARARDGLETLRALGIDAGAAVSEPDRDSVSWAEQVPLARPVPPAPKAPPVPEARPPEEPRVAVPAAGLWFQSPEERSGFRVPAAPGAARTSGKPPEEAAAKPDGRPSGPFGPTPTRTSPVESGPLRPASVQPAPVQPAPVESPPIQPVLTQPAQTRPTPAVVLARASAPGDLLRRAAERLELDDHTGAFALVEQVLASEPGDPIALELKARCEATLLRMCESRLGDLGRRPACLMKREEIVWLNLDHRAGFLLSQVDGTVCFEDLFALSGMSRLETARILASLVQDRIIG